MSINNNIFVYGTLMDGLLGDVFPEIDLFIRKKTNGEIKARLFDIGGYPGARPTIIRTKKVSGEIYEIDPRHLDNILKALDEYEEFNPRNEGESLFRRNIVPVLSGDGILSKAWVYWYNKPTAGKNAIEPGDYKKYLKRKNKLKKNVPE